MAADAGVGGGGALGLLEARERAWSVLARIERGASEHLATDAVALDAVASAIAARHGERLPPSPSGWWELGEEEPAAFETLADRLRGKDGVARARAGLDLALLWAAARQGKSAVATMAAMARLLASGRLAGDGSSIAADAAGIERFLEQEADEVQDVAAVLAGVAACLRQGPEELGSDGRFGNLLDGICDSAGDGRIEAASLIDGLLPMGALMLRGGALVGGRASGDVWRLDGIAAGRTHPGLIPFHAMVQQLAIDMEAPLDEAGIVVHGWQAVTAPATLALCNQLVTLGLIVPRHAAVLRLVHPPGSDIVVELRALATALMDRLADRVRARLDVPAEQLPTVRLICPVATAAAEAARESRRASIAIASFLF